MDHKLMLPLLLGTVSFAFASSVMAQEPTAPPTAQVTAAKSSNVSLNPWQDSAEANALIVRCRISDKKALPKGSGILTDGSLVLKSQLVPVNQMEDRGLVDYEFPLGEVRKLSSAASLELAFDEASGIQVKVESVLRVVFHDKDLSKKIDMETPGQTGVWVSCFDAGAPSSVTLDDVRCLSGKKCMRAEWSNHDGMIALLPGEHDWRNYAVLRLTLANPMPGAESRRTRVAFFFDGKTVLRPGSADLPTSGALDVLPEGVKNYEFDLRLLRKNNPSFDWSNVRSFQIYWSPVVCGKTTFYIDDVQLVTEEQLQKEENARFLDKIVEFKKVTGSAELDKYVAELEKRYAAGERETLTPLLTRAAELVVIQKLKVANPEQKKLAAFHASPAVKIMRDEMPELGKFPLQISAAGNERESFQLVLSPFTELKSVTVTASELVKDNGVKLPAQAVTVEPIGYLEVKTNAFNYKDARPGMWPDVLLVNRAFDLAMRLQPYMITVAVPKDQEAGIYHGSLTIQAQDMEPMTVPYSCKVRNFSLPVRGEMKTWFSMNFVPQDKTLRRKHYDKFFEYRLNPTSMYAVFNRENRNMSPHWIAPALEDVPYCLEHGMNFMSIGYLWDYASKEGWNFDDDYLKVVIDYVNSVKPTLKKYGAWDIAYVNGFDEIMHKPERRDEMLAAAVRACTVLKKAIPDLKIANIGETMTIDNKLMDDWFVVPEARKAYEKIQEKGGFISFYWAYQDPSFMLDQPGIAPRLCAWLVYQQGVSGMGYYSTLRPHAIFPPEQVELSKQNHPKLLQSSCTERCMMKYPDTLDWTSDFYCVESNHGPGRNCDGVLFHPGPDGILLGSQRLVNVRDGIEDFEYFKILEKLPGDHKALLTISPETVSLYQGSYSTDVKKLEAQREAVAQAIEEAMAKQR